MTDTQPTPKKRPDYVTGMDTRQLAVEDYVSTHQVLVRSPLIIDRAVKKRDLHVLKSFAGEKDDLTEVIAKALTVTRSKGPAGNNNILDIACRTHRRFRRAPEQSEYGRD